MTYRDDTLPLTLREVRNDMSVFRRRLRAKAPDVKFVYVIELGADNRLHVHIVLDLPANSQIPEACWNKGHVNVKPLYGNGQYADLANYMLKSTEDTKTYAASLGEKHTQKYTCSRNLQKPEVHTEIITEREVMEPPEEITGYYIDNMPTYQLTSIYMLDVHILSSDYYNTPVYSDGGILFQYSFSFLRGI